MEAKALSEAITALRKEIGPKAEVSCLISDGRYVINDTAVSIYIYPDGMLGHEPNIIVAAETFEELLARARSAWEMRKADVIASKIKKMALAVIRLTFEHGQCTATALCSAGFCIEDVRVYGYDAERAADEMAGGRPFKIVVETP